jgi:Ni/Fe-hydrogenase subunit HybB-like protein
MRYPWLRLPWLVPSRWTSWVWWPGVVVSKRHKAAVSMRHRLHEEQHVRQQRRWLVLAPLVWLALLGWTVAHGRDWYWSHPWEVEARWAAAIEQPYTRTAHRWQQAVGVVATWLVLMAVVRWLGLDLFDTPGWAR